MADAQGSLLTRVMDRLRAPLRPEETRGVVGTPVVHGHIQEQEQSASLQGSTRYKTYSDILSNTSIVAAGTRYFLNLVSKATWRVEPAEDSAEAERLARELEAIMFGMETPWHRVVRRASMYRFYGFSVQEWTARRGETGVIELSEISPRAQRTIEQWDMDQHGVVHGVVQRSPITSEEIYLPREKLIYTVDDTLNDSPEGLGLFRHLVEPANALRRFQQLEGWAFETDLRGTPIGRAPIAALQQLVKESKLSKADASRALRPMEEFIQKHIKHPELGLLLDSMTYTSEDDKQTPSSTPQWAVDLLKGDPNGQEAVAAAIERLNREMARVLGVESLLLGTDSRGSHALARDKTQTFSLMVDSTLQELEETLEKDFRDRVWELNGWPEDLRPSLKTEPVQYRDIEQVTGALRDMAQSGAVLPPDDPAINEIRDLLGLSHQEPLNLALGVADLNDDPGGEAPVGDEDPDDSARKRKGGRYVGGGRRKRRRRT